MTSTRISDKLAVMSQPRPEAFAQAKAEGFLAVVNNRPDGEEPDQPGSKAERRAAEAAGLAYSFIPVTGDAITEADVRAFQTALREAPGPILAHCKSGTRSLALYTIGEVLDGRMKADDIRAFGRHLGYDLATAECWLAARSRRTPVVTGFFDPRTSSIQYVVSDPDTALCAIIDPVLDFDEKSGSTATRSADALLAHVAEQGLTVEWILDTHPHADHLSAAHYLKQKTGAATAIGERIVDVQRLWRDTYRQPSLPADGSQWDRLFADREAFTVGSIASRVLFSPGHTLASSTYVIGDAAFVHDTVFMPDGGTARADFPGGSAKLLWASIQDILTLPDTTRIFTGHDYQPGGRAPRWESTVADQKRLNIHLAGKDEAAFILFREARDRTLPMPNLILLALQVNIQAGRLPEAESDGRRYLRFPLDAFPGAAW